MNLQLQSKEDDRVLNIKEMKAQTGPVFLAYKQNVLIKKILDENKKGDPVYMLLVQIPQFIKYG